MTRVQIPTSPLRIDHPHVHADSCQTDLADYTVRYYKDAIRRGEIMGLLPDNAKVVHKEEFDECGVDLFIEKGH